MNNITQIDLIFSGNQIKMKYAGIVKNVYNTDKVITCIIYYIHYITMKYLLNRWN